MRVDREESRASWTMSCYVGILVAAAVFEASTCADLAPLFLPFLLPWLRVSPRAGNIEFLALVTIWGIDAMRIFENNFKTQNNRNAF